MKPIVIDASASAAWVMPDERNPAADELYLQARTEKDRFHAPALWPWEMGNMMVMGVQRERITADEVDAGLALVAGAHVTVEPPPDRHRQAQVARLALAHGLTYYDAAYLELVLRLNGQLASHDQQLLAAARACGIVCLSF
ncbi:MULTISPECIES: type II toxin-antitoxin system VapC family toxin [Ramlibacter]|uniref:Type II toxin-antitoxin system VapC family toxin n=1 Tax=Ramlibacter aquaticus TaxID=2780094 RepID=A0ABR9SFS5_9BURK|nr:MULTISPECIES: type II toxin-antitoxin system VapC family toxin [Ramlibacter]MBE7941205.1 type II toxin-antitoxin system VapC family toxin [Ramlibacter aquaticus]